ncbi:hypothetical protein [Kribbella sp. NPDC048915]|uniref:hypothetical protein n=1 Tax=Kribbella sp. NPDC048915 TaxID=3155148 RepID=UPI0033C1D10B
MSHQQQPPPFQQPQPQQYQPQVPTGMLQLTIQGSALTSNMIPPTVHLNGYPVPVKYGRNDIPVFAGPLHIEVHSQWMLTYGRAALDCTVFPNQAVPVFYASPYHQFTSGSIGHSKVKRKGLGVLLGVVGGILAVAVLASVLAALG